MCSTRSKLGAPGWPVPGSQLSRPSLLPARVPFGPGHRGGGGTRSACVRLPPRVPGPVPSGARRLAGDADWSPLAPRSCTTRARLPEAAAVSHAPTPPSLPPLRVRGNRRTSRGRCPPRRRRKRCPCRLVSPGRGGLRPVTTHPLPPRTPSPDEGPGPW